MGVLKNRILINSNWAPSFLFGLTIVLVSQVTNRFIELFELSESLKISPSLFFSYSINFDILIILIASLPILILFLILRMLNDKLASNVLVILFSLLVIFNTVLSGYYIISSTPLTSVLLQFNIKDLSQIISSEFKGRAGLFVVQFTNILISLFLLRAFIIRGSHKNKLAYPLIILVYIIISILNLGHTTKDIKFFSNRSDYAYYNSKLALLAKSFYSNNFQKHKLTKLNPYLTEVFQKQFPAKHFTSTDYPLIHENNYPNVLGPFFQTSKTPPNIVIIISESLSNNFSGKKAKYSLTPFTDSLRNESLSWENFLSNAEKSYGVLPNLLSSLPNSLNQRGFINLLTDDSDIYPNHTSLIQILSEQNYFTSFYYGGWGDFDNISSWTKLNGINRFVDQKNIEAKFDTEIKSSESEFVWGFNDKVVFNAVIDDQKNINQPYLNIVQTLSLHSPFNLATEVYFDSHFLNSRLKAIGKDISSITELHQNQIACIYFADDALRGFFQKAKSQPSFNNTIFIITGDHALDSPLNTDFLDQYKVPLIIYSPLIKKSKSLKGVSSHIDVTPTLLSLLKNNFHVKTPEKSHWLGSGLDTSSSNNFSNPVPFNLARKDLPVFVNSKGLFLGNQLFPIDNNLQINQSKGSNLSKEDSIFISAQFYINGYCIENDKILEY